MKKQGKKGLTISNSRMFSTFVGYYVIHAQQKQIDACH